MNILKILLAAFIVTIMALGIYSCAKDEIKSDQNTNFTTQNRTSLPAVITGMLHFDSYSDFESYVKDLEVLENDTNQIMAAYIYLGVDLTQEFLPNLTDYPVALRREQQIIGFSSARKAEETVINNALNSGDYSVFSIVSNPYLKSALNSNFSVHIGSRIFKFYTNGGVAIVLNNDWVKYNTIKTLGYDNLRQTGSLIVTNDEQESWNKLYNIGSDGKISTEKEYVEPTPTNTESPLACDFSDALVVTNLNDGKIRVELPSNIYDIFEWTFSDGTKAFGNPLIIDCNQKSNGSVTLDVWVLDPSVPNGKRRICRGTAQFFCKCGEKKSKNGQEEWNNAGQSGKRIRIDATIWVEDGNIECRSRHFGRRLGTWMPLNWVHGSFGIFANISSFIREVTLGNCVIVNQPFNEKQNPGGNNATWQNIISQPGRNFIDPDNLSSGHRLRLRQGNNPSGTFFGFGVDRPRLILN